MAITTLALIGWWLCTTPPDGGVYDASPHASARPDVGRLDSCAGPSMCAGAQERAGNDTEPVEVPLTRPASIDTEPVEVPLTRPTTITSVPPRPDDPVRPAIVRPRALNLPPLPQPPRNVLRHLTRKQRRQQREYDHRRPYLDRNATSAPHTRQRTTDPVLADNAGPVHPPKTSVHSVQQPRPFVTGWEEEEVELKATVLLRDLDDHDQRETATRALTENVSLAMRMYVRACVCRNITTGFRGAKKCPLFTKGAYLETYEVSFGVPKSSLDSVLASTFAAGIYFAMSEEARQEYTEIMLGDSASLSEAIQWHETLGHRSRGIVQCRGDYGIRVAKADGDKVIGLMFPDGKVEVGYFLVEGVPSRTVADTLAQKLSSAGWPVVPLFQKRRGALTADWVVKSEKHPAVDSYVRNGVTLRFRHTPRPPLEQAKLKGGEPPAAHSPEAPDTTAYPDPLSDSLVKRPRAYFDLMYGDRAANAWRKAAEAAGAPDEDINETPLEGECVAVEISRIGLPSLKVYNVYHPPPKSSHTNLDMEPFPMDDTVIIAGDLNTHHPDWSHGAINAGGRNLKDWLVEVSAMAATRAKTSHWDKIAVRINRCTGVALLFRQVRMLDGRGGQHQSIPPLWNGKAFCVDAKGKAELFGRHLEAVCGGASAVPSHRWAPKKRPSDDDIGCGPISEDELDRALKDLDPKTSLDPDGICSEFLSRLDGGAKRLVLELLNISWDEGFVPDSWRDAHVIPAAKPGRDHSLPEGYRPISLTSVTSKLMEVIVKNRLVFLTENDSVTQVLPFCTRQGGFRRQRGTEEQLYSIVTTIDCAGPTFRRVCLLSFDLANAFDTVDHALLLDAMQSKGVPPKFLVWLESFLRNRKAAFKVDGATGEKFHLKHGVPQGTVLGPVLFLYHIDDLGTSLEALNKRIVADSESRSWINFSLFADDDGVVVSSPSHFQLEKYTQEVVDVVEEWTFKAKMHLSKLKTEGVLFRDPGAPEPYPVTTRFNATAVDVLVPDDYVIALKSRSTWKFLEPDEHSPWHQHHGKLIVSVDEKNGGDKDATKNRLVTIRVADALRWVDKTKLLGLVIDSELTFVPHMQRVVDKFSLKMNFLRHLSGKSFGCNSCTLRTLYLTYVLPTYTYALSVYGPYLLRSTSPLVTTLERLHRRAQVILLGCRKNTSDFSAQQESGILPLRAIANLRVAALRERMRLRSTLWQNDLAMNTTLRRSYDALCEKAGTVECKREAFVFNPFAPWTPSPKVTIVATLPGKKSDSAAEKRRIVESRLNRLEPPDCSAWIDGSVLDGAPPTQPPPSKADRWDERHRPWLKRYADKTAWGGAGLYFEFEPSITPSLRDVADLKTATGNRHTTSRSSPVGKHVHSYRAEQVALYSALVFLRQHLAPTSRPLHILVLSDSQSFLKTLSAGPHSQVEPLAIECWTILSEMEARGYDVTLHFVYGHCGLEGNDAADVLAKAAALGYRRAAGASSSDHPEPFPLTVAGAVCRYRTYLRLNSSEAGAKEAFERADGHGNLSPFARIVHGRPIPRRRHLTPRAEREVRQLRTGHHRLIMTLYATDWRSFSEAELQSHFLPCPVCGVRSTSPLLHLFVHCRDLITAPLRAAMRHDITRRIKKDPGGPIDSLWYYLFVHPEHALFYLQRAGALPPFQVLVESDNDEAPPNHEYGLVPIM
ncbi:RNA-directed DNA polymerase from mobile element jockey [Diplonema papillatum]|nr:RNA-directed DNA polymerase from mobile element jockey [Diplonema papillatum]